MHTLLIAPAELMALQGEHGAAPVRRAHGAHELVVDDAGCITDIDTLEDLSRAEALWRARAAAAGCGPRSRGP